MASQTTTNLSPVEEALGFAELSKKEQEEILLDLHKLIYEGTMIRVMERMNADAKNLFLEMIEADASQEDIAGFIEANVPDADSAVQETISELTSDILQVTKGI